jgi:hypothetical protein
MTELADLPLEKKTPSATWLAPVAIAIAIFASLSIYCAITSEGFLEADSCTHYLFARLALREPHDKNLSYLVNVWGRPLCTGIYAVPALIGHRTGVRLMSCALALICGLGAMRVAKLQNYRWPALALIFTLAQPLVFLHSFSELTELPFAALVILAFWAYRARQFWLMGLLVGISPMGRPEGFGTHRARRGGAGAASDVGTGCRCFCCRWRGGTTQAGGCTAAKACGGSGCARTGRTRRRACTSPGRCITSSCSCRSSRRR